MTVPVASDVTVGDRYVLEERIAVGGMGEVWRARDQVLSRTVAVKVLKPEYAADPAFLRRFRDEARHTAALSHPGIANVFDYGELGDARTGHTAFLVMEYVRGEPLSALLAREGRLPPDRTLDVLGQAALALQSAHEAGVVHRDVKPGNLLVRPDGVVKVTDFGIARAVDSAPVTRTGFLVGTAAYLSPEQVGGHPATPASDIYGLGVVGYECLAGRRPFDADNPMAVAMAHLREPPPPLPKDVPPLVADLVLRTLDKDPAKRPPSAGDLGRTALALAATMRDQAASAEPPTVAAAAPGGGDTRVLTAPVPLDDSPPGPPPSAGAPGPVPDPVPDDARRRRIRAVFVAIGAAVVVLGFLALRACGPSTPQRAPTPKASASPRPSATATPRVTVTAADYLGRPVAAARAALSARGLTVRTVDVTSTAAAGTVVGVAPTGSLPRGTTVTLSVAKPPAAPAGPAKPPPHGGKHKAGHGDH